MARSEVCLNCCPDGGALFDVDFGCWPHVKTGEMMSEAAWVKVCRNCGHYKPQRKRRPALTFDEVLAQTDESKLRNKRERAIFHAFNKNGAWETYVRICDAYAAKCSELGIAEWPFLLHKWNNTYDREKLLGHAKLSAWKVDMHVRGLQSQARRAQTMAVQFCPEGAAA